MLTHEFMQAASILAARRRNGEPGPLLPDALRPRDVEDALRIQACVTEQLGERIGGWKCGLSPDNPVVIGCIHAGTIHTRSPCPVWETAGHVKIEPELAFILGQDLPPRDVPYSPAEIDAAIADVHLALELIGTRYAEPASASIADHLADGLLNQGLLIGPRIDADRTELGTIGIEVQPENGRSLVFDGKHPNGDPRAPLHWLAEFLRGRGQGLRAGQAVITGSYAGSFDVPVGPDIAIRFGELGSLTVRFTPK